MVKESAFVSLEGSYDHNRHDSLCLLTMMGTSTSRIVDHYVCKCQKQNVKANTNAVPGNRERESVDKRTNRWKNHPRAKYSVHHGDSKTKEVG
jgi:surfactin synthase thioesterase subunit